MPSSSDEIEYALSVLLDEFRDTPLTSEDIRRETVDFVCEHTDFSRQTIEAVYDQLYPRQFAKAWLG